MMSRTEHILRVIYVLCILSHYTAKRTYPAHSAFSIFD